MTTTIEIEGNLVRTIERTVLAETTLEAMAPHLEVRAPSISPGLPRGNGYSTAFSAVDPDNNRGAIIIERQPSRDTITVHFDRGLEPNTPEIDYGRAVKNPDLTAQWTLQFPYLFFVYGYTLTAKNVDRHIGLADFKIDRTLLYMSKDPLTNLDQPLWNARILNVNAKAVVCWGYTQHTNASLAQRLQHMVSDFSVTVFNNHYGVPRPSNFSSMTEWEKNSKISQPLAFTKWTHWNRPPEVKSAAEMLRNVIQGDTNHDYALMPVADDINTDIDLPELPQRATYARILEWVNTVPVAYRERFTRNLQQILADPRLVEDALEANADNLAELDDPEPEDEVF